MQKWKIQMWWVQQTNQKREEDNENYCNSELKRFRCYIFTKPKTDQTKTNLDMEFNKIICVPSFKRYKSMLNSKWLYFVFKWAIVMCIRSTIRKVEFQIMPIAAKCHVFATERYRSCQYGFLNWFISVSFFLSLL